MNQIKLLEATQGKPVWVARIIRDGWECNGIEYYGAFRTKKEASNAVVGNFVGSMLYDFCVEDFEHFTGLKLNPGEYMRIRFGVSPV